MIKIKNGGLSTTIQDYPGRVGYWDVGIPPSGPMDSYAFRIANLLVGNSENNAGLEMTAIGAEMEFERDAVIAFTGAELKGTLNREKIPWWTAIEVKEGSIIKFSGINGSGFRTYMSVSGGLEAPIYLGSKSTFAFGKFGGLDGRRLEKGDNLKLNGGKTKLVNLRGRKKLPDEYLPQYTNNWKVKVVVGPHGIPDIFTKEDQDMFLNTEWKVNHNSNRLGYRLEGPSFEFARESGGDGGEHPSNMLDYAYGIGNINISGDTPVILTADGPSLGGFVSFMSIPSYELWKIGQAQPNNKISFEKISLKKAREEKLDREVLFDKLKLLFKYGRVEKTFEDK